MSADDALDYQFLLQTSHINGQVGESDSVSLVKLVTMLVITVGVSVSELVLAEMSHSICLLVLVHQNIYNSISLAVSCVTSIKGSEPGLKNTFGWRRMEVVGSLFSLVFLFSLCFATLIEALQTVFHTNHLDTMHHPEWIMMLVAGQVAVWLVSLFTIGGYSYHQTGAAGRSGKGKGGDHTSGKLDCAAKVKLSNLTRDLSGCLFTLLTASLVQFQVVSPDFSAYIDPVISMVYIIFLVWSCVPLVKESCLILLQTIPGNIEVSLLKQFVLKKFPGILTIHEFHIWTLTPSRTVLTAHITYKDQEVYWKTQPQVETFFRSQGFSQVTVQPEFPSMCSAEDSGCTLVCKGGECRERTCCATSQSDSDTTLQEAVHLD